VKIRRPEEKSGGKAITRAELLWYGTKAILAKSRPKFGAYLRSFYQSASWPYTEAFQFKGSPTGSADRSLFETADRCREGADQAREEGFTEEAAVLYITGARLSHRAYSIAQMMENWPYTKPQMMGIMLGAFEGLGAICTLPDDDAEYWQDRLAEAVAPLFGFVVVFGYQGMDHVRALHAVFDVAQVVKNLLPCRPEAKLTPMRLGDYYPGSEDRIHASLAHLEILGQHFTGSALCSDRVAAFQGDRTLITDKEPKLSS